MKGAGNVEEKQDLQQQIQQLQQMQQLKQLQLQLEQLELQLQQNKNQHQDSLEKKPEQQSQQQSQQQQTDQEQQPDQEQQQQADQGQQSDQEQQTESQKEPKQKYGNSGIHEKHHFELPKIVSVRDLGHLQEILSSKIHAVKQYRQAKKNCQLPDIKSQIEEVNKMHLKNLESLLAFLEDVGGQAQ